LAKPSQIRLLIFTMPDNPNTNRLFSGYTNGSAIIIALRKWLRTLDGYLLIFTMPDNPQHQSPVLGLHGRQRRELLVVHLLRLSRATAWAIFAAASRVSAKRSAVPGDIALISLSFVFLTTLGEGALERAPRRPPPAQVAAHT
jgi:hypothetical protein